MSESLVFSALGFFAGLSAGLAIALALCVWWVRTVHDVAYQDDDSSENEPVGEDTCSEENNLSEEEAGEWWKR